MGCAGIGSVLPLVVLYDEALDVTGDLLGRAFDEDSVATMAAALDEADLSGVFGDGVGEVGARRVVLGENLLADELSAECAERLADLVRIEVVDCSRVPNRGRASDSSSFVSTAGRPMNFGCWPTRSSPKGRWLHCSHPTRAAWRDSFLPAAPVKRS